MIILVAIAGCGKVQPVKDGGDGEADAPDAGDATGDLPTDGSDVTTDDAPTVCVTDEDCDDGDPCTDDACVDGESCDHSFNTEPCSDGYDCTTGDICDGAGSCTGGTPDDGACGSGELCRPECFSATGCGAAPTSLVVDCPDTVTLPAAASCSISLDGVAGQSACIDCTTGIGPVVLSNDDFEGTGGACGGLGGWSLVTCDNCMESVSSGAPCTPGGRTTTCCSDASTIIANPGSDCFLRSDRDNNCSGDEREWRIERTHDTSGLADIEVCFRIAEDGATNNEGVLLHAEDSTHSEQVFCQMGPIMAGGPAEMEWPYCVVLPAWAQDNPALVLRFIVHSHDGGDILYLDDIVVRGWPDVCTFTRTVAFEEDFDPCPSPTRIADGWNGWSVTTDGAGPTCTNVCTGGTSGGARAADEEWTMIHAVDTSGLDADVRLCFDVGDHRADGGEWIKVSLDTGGWWLDAWEWEDQWGTDDACERVCLNLTDIDRAAARNPGLRIRFNVRSDASDRFVYIDDVVVDGVALCDGTGSLLLDTPSDEGGGSYTIEMENDAGTQMWAEMTCSWDSPPTPVTGSDGTRFMP
ncbi:MAG: hypothetical protein JRG91_19270 [Deltaproteobacteria bacterium]|nr:hypothetical protein [Deltaproteobacteria bacterium]